MTPRSLRRPEIDQKLQRLRAVMATQWTEALVLRRPYNTAWLTAGAATYVNVASDEGASAIVVTPTEAFVVTDAVEAPRLEQEEKLSDLGFTFAVERWYARGTELRKILAGKSVGQDGPAPGSIGDFSILLELLRSQLQPPEVERLRHVAQLATAAVMETVRAVRPGMTEFAIAAMLDAACRTRGGIAIINLVAADDRVARFRHPLPTAKTVERYVMVVLCFRYEGLIAAVTRLVHFGPLPEDLRRRALAVAEVDARLILGTQDNRTLGDQWELARDAYAQVGFPEAIEEHHQGGIIAYLPRETLAQPRDPTLMFRNQAFAWNPSVRGVKSEDTILLGDQGPEILTSHRDWPIWTVKVGDRTVDRPAILEL